MLVLCVRALTLPGTGAGLSYLFAPNLETAGDAGARLLTDALGQSFFSLSVGMGTLMTYASYFGRDVRLAKTAGTMAALDTAVALLAGVIIFPAAFALAAHPESMVETLKAGGPGLVFISIPQLLQSLPAAQVWSVFFFLLLVLASLTSTISLFEVITAFVHEEVRVTLPKKIFSPRGEAAGTGETAVSPGTLRQEYRIARPFAAVVIAAGIIALGVFCACSLGENSALRLFGLSFFDFLDFLTAKLMMPLGGIFISLFAGRRLDKKILEAEYSNAGTLSLNGDHTFGNATSGDGVLEIASGTTTFTRDVGTKTLSVKNGAEATFVDGIGFSRADATADVAGTLKLAGTRTFGAATYGSGLLELLSGANVKFSKSVGVKTLNVSEDATLSGGVSLTHAEAVLNLAGTLALDANADEKVTLGGGKVVLAPTAKLDLGGNAASGAAQTQTREGDDFRRRERRRRCGRVGRVPRDGFHAERARESICRDLRQDERADGAGADESRSSREQSGHERFELELRRLGARRLGEGARESAARLRRQRRSRRTRLARSAAERAAQGRRGNGALDSRPALAEELRGDDRHARRNLPRRRAQHRRAPRTAPARCRRGRGRRLAILCAGADDFRRQRHGDGRADLRLRPLRRVRGRGFPARRNDDARPRAWRGAGTGDADIHNGGGKIESDDYRLTAFGGKTLGENAYVNAGAQIGFSSYDVKRTTDYGSARSETDGWNAGAFAEAGVRLAISEANGLYATPYVGLAYTHAEADSFKEDGGKAAFDADSLSGDSLRARIGCAFSWGFDVAGARWRVGLDAAYSRELLDDEIDVDVTASDGSRISETAAALPEDVFSIGPTLNVDVSVSASIYAGYAFNAGTDSSTAHSANVGFRMRF